MVSQVSSWEKEITTNRRHRMLHDRKRGSLAVYFTLGSILCTTIHLIVSAAKGASILVPRGLIDSMSGLFYISVFTVVVTVALILMQGKERPILLGINLSALTVILHGTVTFMEPIARFPTAWLHAGYTQYVMDHNDVLPDLGARFSWPGFFTATASIFSGAGETMPVEAIRWAPIFFCLAYLPPLLAISRSCLDSWQAAWVSLVIFSIINWVGQDYFAPQTWSFLLLLCIIAIILNWFSNGKNIILLRFGHGNATSTWQRLTSIFERQNIVSIPSKNGNKETIIILSCLMFLMAAMSMSHQLTPYVLAIQLGGLWIASRVRSVAFAFMMGLMALIWTSWGAFDFWAAHAEDMFGSVGRPADIIESTVADRSSGSSDHDSVIQLRMLYSLSVWLLAIFSVAWDAFKSKVVDLALVLLAFLPFSMLLLQDYGGEGMLRVFLYASPFMAMLLAKSLIGPPGLTKLSALVLVIVVTAVSPVFLVARYGNELFERVTVSEVALANCMYDTAPKGSTLGAVSPHLAWQFRGQGEYQHVSVNATSFDASTVKDLTEMFPPTSDSNYLIVTDPQIAFVERTLGAGNAWGGELREEISEDNRFSQVCSNDGGEVLKFTWKGGSR